MGSNYRAACRANSTTDFINKLKTVEEEADETLYWLELLKKSGFLSSNSIAKIREEVNEILSNRVASIRTLRKKIIAMTEMDIRSSID